MSAPPLQGQRVSLALAAGATLLVVLLHVGGSAWLGDTELPAPLALLGRMHPMAVHLPVALLILLAILETLATRPRLRGVIDPVLAVLLPVAVATGLAAFTLGMLLAAEGGQAPGLLRWHRRLAVGIVAGTAATWAAWAVHERSPGGRLLYRLALAGTLVVMTIGAHFGGSMTHGERYLTEHAPAFARRWLGGDVPAAAPAVAPTTGPSSDARVFADVVMPVLQERCVRCHGPDKAKNKLRVDSLDGLLKGGDRGPAIVPGKPAESLVVASIRKDVSDDEHMPPEGEPQVTSDELELLAWWIERGAREDLLVRDMLVPDGARRLLGAAVVGDGAAQKPTEDEAPDDADGTSKAKPSGDADAPRGAAASPAAPSEDASAGSSPGSAAGSSPGPTTALASAARAPRRATHADVAQLLAAKCGRCHGAQKQRGKLRTDSVAALLAGGSEGPAVVPRQPDRSPLLARVELPLDDSDHMPPDGEPQLAAAEIALLRAWIAAGAPAGGAPSAAGGPIATRGGPASTSSAAGDASSSPGDAGVPGDSTPAATADATAEPAPGAETAGADAGAPTGDDEESETEWAAAPPAVRPAGCAGCATTRGDAGGRAAAAVVVLAGALVARRRRSP